MSADSSLPNASAFFGRLETSYSDTVIALFSQYWGVFAFPTSNFYGVDENKQSNTIFIRMKLLTKISQWLIFYRL